MTTPAPATIQPLRSWRWLLPCAALPVASFAILSLLGGKAYVQVIAGLQPFTAFELLLGAAYLAAYVATATLTPVFALAAAFVAVWDFLQARRARAADDDDSARRPQVEPGAS